MKFNPGPRSPRNLPKRNTTPRWYCQTILTAGTTISRRTNNIGATSRRLGISNSFYRTKLSKTPMAPRIARLRFGDDNLLLRLFDDTSLSQFPNGDGWEEFEEDHEHQQKA